MSERTGATDDPVYDMIHDAVYDNYGSADSGHITDETIGRLAANGMVVARAADILTTEQRAAIGRVIVDLDNYEGIACSQPRAATWDDFQSLRAIAEGGTE